MMRRLFKRAVGQCWFTATPGRGYMRNAVSDMQRVSATENLAIQSVTE